MIPATDIAILVPAPIQTASLPEPSPAPARTAPPHLSNRCPNTSPPWVPLPHNPVAAVPPWLLQTVHGAILPGSTLLQALPNGPAIARAGSIAAALGSEARYADDSLMNWISGRRNKSPAGGTTDCSTTPQSQTPSSANPKDLKQQILDEWKLTGQLDKEKIWLYVATASSYPSRAAGLMKSLELVDELLCESESSHVRLIENPQLDELANGTFNRFLRIARIFKTKPENDPTRREVVSRFRHVLHHHAKLLHMFESFCDDPSIRSRLTSCKMTVSIKALRCLRDSEIRMSDNELDELFGLSTAPPSTWNDIQQAIQSRLFPSKSHQSRPPLRSLPPASSEEVGNVGSYGNSTTTSTHGDAQSIRQHAGKRQQSELNSKENGAPAKRHRVENAEGLAPPVLEPSQNHPTAVHPSGSDDSRIALSASPGSMNTADIGEAPSSDPNEIAMWLSLPLFECVSNTRQADDGPAPTFNDKQISESQHGSDDSFWEKFFQEPYW